MKMPGYIGRSFASVKESGTGERLLFLVGFYFCIIALSVAYKVLFMLLDCGNTDCSAADCIRVIYHGLAHDFAVAGYFTAIPLLLVIVSVFWNLPMKRFFMGYNMLIAFAMALAFLSDLTLYPYWEFKLDASVLIYLDSPGNALASIAVWQIMLLLVLLAISTYGIYRLLTLAMYRSRHASARFKECGRKAATAITMTLLGGVIFLGIRGGVTESTNNIGTVYHCNRQFLNDAAVNPIFSFLDTVIYNEDFCDEYSFFGKDELDRVFNGLYVNDPTLTDTLLTCTRPNIITIILEGMSACLIEELGGMKGVTPNFNRLSKEGVLFTGCYANSFRTDRGLICTLSGYPSFPKTSVMKDAKRSRTLPSLASSLKSAGYSNTFIYGGDINFTNMSGYLYSTGYERIISDNDFTMAERKSHRWGAGDDITFNRLYDVVMKQKNEPWQTTLLTLSSHEPWTVPYNRIPDDEVANSFAFTDEQFGRFIDRLKETEIWENTLVVCIPDHSVTGYPDGISQTDRNRNHIPLLLLGGAVKEAKRIDVTFNQSDLAATLLAQLQLPADEFRFSRNILGEQYAYPFAYHCYNNGISLMDSTGFSVYDLNSGKEIMQQPSEGGGERIKRAKAILQTTYGDFYNR